MSIIVSDLVKRFGNLVVVNHVSLEIADGELFVLLGGSGSGKSTILRMIAGLSDPDAGKIELHGRDVTHLPPQKRDTGFVFQNYSIFRHMTVADNIEFGLMLRKTSPAERRKRRDELLELVGLTGLGNRFASQLSGGQQQRVALARALAYQPSVLLLDEPFGALDVKIRAQLRQSLKEIQDRLKITTILVTHDQEEAFELADRIGVLDRGNLLEIGRPEELYLRPRSQFVATFVGNANLLVGRMEGSNVRVGRAMLPMEGPAPGHLEGAPVRVLFRPEDLVVQPEEFPAGGPIQPLGRATVTDSVFAGSLVRLKLAVEELRGVRTISPPPVYGQALPPVEAVVAGEHGVLQPGQSLYVGVKRYHLLERTGMKALIAWGDENVARWAMELLRQVDAPGTLLGTEDERPAMQAFVARYNSNLAIATSSLPMDRAALQAVQEGRHEIVILDRKHADLASTVLFGAVVPVVVAPTVREKLGRVLICTAGGEPGKADVWMGGRVARRAGASAVVLHVSRPGTEPDVRERVDQHLRQAMSTLESMGVPTEILLREHAEPATAILAEADSGGYDLVVVGAPDPGERRELMYRGRHLPILGGAHIPIMMVPMPAE